MPEGIMEISDTWLLVIFSAWYNCTVCRSLQFNVDEDPMRKVRKMNMLAAVTDTNTFLRKIQRV